MTESVTAQGALTRVRALCLALPEATEKEAWGMATFRVRNRIFAHFADNHHGDGRVAVWLKAAAGAQELLVEADPERFFAPPYVGPRGWVGMRLDDEADPEELADLVEDAYRLTAPKRLIAALETKRA